MSREWEVPCKWPGCTNKVGYSDRSFRNSLKYGFSRPEYCEEHQKEERGMRKGVATPYFHIPQFIGQIEPGPLGFIKRPQERTHVPTDKPSAFDETLYGLTKDKIREIADWFSNPNHRVVVVVGPTGSGKSTALPYWLVYPPEGIEEDFFTRDGQILVTQPRIVAVTGIADYLGSDLMGSSVGAGYDIGYSYSQEDKADWRNAIELVTDGKLINWIVAGRIGQYGIIVIDEAHERSENIETILRLLKERMSLYPNLKLIIASATIDAKMFCNYFAQDGATIVEFEGKARVDIHGNPVSYKRFFAPDSERVDYENLKTLSKAVSDKAERKIKWLVGEIVSQRKDWGDVLIFLQGKGPIEKLVEKLRGWASQDPSLRTIVEIYPLYRELDDSEKDKVLKQDPKPGKIRVVVSTNIAEASVTIDSVVYEIETGVENQARFNVDIDATEVLLTRISKANAKQRWGRTGRTRNGEVYCLYTESQFNDDSLFSEYPVPAMQRSRLESVVLSTRSAGIPSASRGWLEDQAEIEDEVLRSTQSLVATGALDEEGSLTFYGSMLRYFSYPPRLFDLIIAAEDLGCSVEMATLLPVIKNGGRRYLLNWNRRWDAYTKRIAHKRHIALMAGCRDNVEFILKLYKAWSELPWLDEKQLKELSEEEINSLRRHWADIHYVNHKVMMAIAKERSEETLKNLRVHTKDKDERAIDLSQINRVRFLLRTMLMGEEVKSVSEPYRYVAEVKPSLGTLITCSLIPDNQVFGVAESWIDLPEFVDENGDDFSRFFVEQVYPIGYQFAATIEQMEQGFAWVRTKNLTQAQAPVQQIVLEEEEVSSVDELEDENLDVDESKEAPHINLADFPIRYGSVRCRQAAQNVSPAVRGEIAVEIVGYNYQYPTISEPVVLAKFIPHPEPFDDFARKHRYGDKVNVEVLGILQWDGENDDSVVLVVRDLDTNLEILLEPQDLNFEHCQYAARTITAGIFLTLNVERVDIESRRVRLSNWESVEKMTTGLLSASKEVVRAYAIEIRHDGRMLFMVDGSDPQSGICVVASAFGNKLPKDPTEYGMGEAVVLRLGFPREPAYIKLPSLPERAISQITTEESLNELSWKDGILRFAGRMTYDRLYELKAIAEDILFHQALETLFWFSNRLFVLELVSESYTDPLELIEIGRIYQGNVVAFMGSGMLVELATSVVGMVPYSHMYRGRNKAQDLFSKGDKILVRVNSINHAERRLDLDMRIPENNPVSQMYIGQTMIGSIVNITHHGAFIEIAPGVDGLLRLEDFPKSSGFLGLGRKPTIEVGSRLEVKIVSIQPKRKDPSQMDFALAYIRHAK